MPTQGTLSHKGHVDVHQIYKDDVVTFYIHDICGEGELMVLHAEVPKTTNREVLLHIYGVLEHVCSQMRNRGFKELEAWCGTEADARYAQFFGFEFLGELTIDDKRFEPPVYRLVKRL